MLRVHLDKIASATGNVELRRDIRLSDQVVAREGYIVAGRIRGEKTTYNQLEDVHGRMMTLHDGDIIAGVLGHRNALHGYSGFVPDSLRSGETLQLLNLGGVIGRCTSENPDVGHPFDIELLGSVLVFPDFENRNGVPAHIGMDAISADGSRLPQTPVVYVAGTCMNSGKTSAATKLIRELASAGLAVGACKLTGVALRRDTLQMLDYGARWAVSFTDAGIVSTTGDNAVAVARTLIAHLHQCGAQVIVAELGDGIMGDYGVWQILAERDLARLASAMVLCANDPVGAWGAQRVLRDEFGLTIDVVSGPTTDNAVGTRYIREELGVEAINARTNGRLLGEFIARRLAERQPPAAPTGTIDVGVGP
jgi:hypothetical protein